VQRLADYFRYALRQNGDLVPLAAEMSFVQNYLEVQKIRFPDAFTVSYAIDEGLEDALTPPLLIQNFVENSIKHGLKLGDVIEVAIEVRRQGDAMVITVSDTGSGIAPEILEKLTNGEIIENKTGRRIGVWNCRRRLRYFYGDRASLTIASVLGEGTQVRIVLPIVRNRSEGAGASATTSTLGMERNA
jgi:sensor histidine kinase YesM